MGWAAVAPIVEAEHIEELRTEVLSVVVRAEVRIEQLWLGRQARRQCGRRVDRILVGTP